MKQIALIFFVLYICTTSIGCNTWHSYHKERIVYYVFDSLENYLAEDFRLKGYDSTHIAIYLEPVLLEDDMKGKWIHPHHSFSPDLFNLGILDMSSRDSVFFASIARRSNRVMLIGGKYYQLYLSPYDRIFTSKSNKSDIHGVMRLFSLEHFITIDMAKKTFYIQEGVERGLP